MPNYNSAISYLNGQLYLVTGNGVPAKFAPVLEFNGAVTVTDGIGKTVITVTSDVTTESLTTLLKEKENYLGKPIGDSTYLVGSDSEGNRTWIAVPEFGLGGAKIDYLDVVYELDSAVMTHLFAVNNTNPGISFIGRRLKIENSGLITCTIEVRNSNNGFILGKCILDPGETGVFRLDQLNGFYVQGQGSDVSVTYSTLTTQ